MHGVAVGEGFEGGGVGAVGRVGFEFGELGGHRRPVGVQQAVLAQEFVHVGLRLRRVTQQQREEVLFFVFVVQRGGNVEILGDLAHGLHHDVVTAVFGDVVVEHADLFAEAAHFAVAGVEHFHRLVECYAFCVEKIHVFPFEAV